MAKQLTPKQEKFCLKYIETGNASEAYRQAYDCEDMKPATIGRNATALLDNNTITTHLNYLRSIHMQRHKVTVDSLTDELQDAMAFSKSEGNPSALVSAIMGKAKIHGLDKLIIEGDLKLVKIKDMTGKK